MPLLFTSVGRDEGHSAVQSNSEYVRVANASVLHLDYSFAGPCIVPHRSGRHRTLGTSSAAGLPSPFCPPPSGRPPSCRMSLRGRPARSQNRLCGDCHVLHDRHPFRSSALHTHVARGHQLIRMPLVREWSHSGGKTGQWSSRFPPTRRGVRQSFGRAGRIMSCIPDCMCRCQFVPVDCRKVLSTRS